MKTPLIISTLLGISIVASSASAPRSPFDQLNTTAPKSIFDQFRDSAPRSEGVFGALQNNAP